MVFFNQWSNRPETVPQEFKEPTCTVPNQSMTVQEIIAKYTRAGIVPAGMDRKKAGALISSMIPSRPDGEVATDPGFDPLDEGMDILEAAEAARQAAEAAAGSEQSLTGTGSEPDSNSAPDGAGEGGE